MRDAFMCRCSKKEAAKCDTMNELAKRILEQQDWNVPETNEDLYPLILMALCQKGSVTINADQWFGIHAEQRHYQDGETILDKQAYIECDIPLDGLCAAYVTLNTETT